MRTVALACSFLLLARVVEARQAVDPGTAVDSVIFHLDEPGVEPGEYSIQLQSNGLGAYWLGQPYFNLEEAVGPQKIRFGQSTIRSAMAAWIVVKESKCETHSKNIAQTGRKTIIFHSGGAAAQCEFNYSDDDRLNAAVSVFEAIAETMQYGARLQHEHRFDRLGLDAEMDSLISENKDGRAIELQNIAPVLQSIVDDDRVIDRVRRKAARLLQDAAPAPSPL
jgi:hypothetical protein